MFGWWLFWWQAGGPSWREAKGSREAQREALTTTLPTAQQPDSLHPETPRRMVDRQPCGALQVTVPLLRFSQLLALTTTQTNFPSHQAIFLVQNDISDG